MRCSGRNSTPRSDGCLPVLIGADVEVSNFIVGTPWPGDTCEEASRILLEAVRSQNTQSHADLLYAYSKTSGGSYDDSPKSAYADSDGYESRAATPSQCDMGRTWLPAGTCYYIDMAHLEACIAETLSARGFVAAWHAATRVIEQARQTASARLRPGEKLVVLFNNSDGQDHSFGSHLNFLVPRRTWDDIFYHKSIFLPFLASFQVASMVITGQGKVGVENGQAAVDYQISQRADFLETMRGPQTTFNRPIVNARDESLCGHSDRMARLHVISYDSNLCPTACYLKVGMMQIVLVMLQRGLVDPRWVLEDPVSSAVQISHAPTLQTRVPTITGEHVTAVELLRGFFEEARRLVAKGGCRGLVPDAEKIIARWNHILTLLEARDWNTLARHLDWVLKKSLIERALKQRPGMTWTQARMLDQLYASSDPAAGLYWACERDGLVEMIVTRAEIERAVHEPPVGTRAWTRGKLIQMAGPAIEHVNWDCMRFRVAGHAYCSRCWTLDVSDPFLFAKAHVEPLFKATRSIEELLDHLSALMPDPACGAPIT